jgi:hypothetical protein
MSRFSPLYTSVTANDAENELSRRQETVILDANTTQPDHHDHGSQLTATWSVGALGAASMATAALVINTSVLIWALRRLKFEHGVAQVFAGNCHRTETINTGVHLAINALSTILLSGSNYCMQILSASTGKEIDRAHAKKRWLDFGVQSFQNLKAVPTRKVVKWWLLCLSSLPLHLM